MSIPKTIHQMWFDKQEYDNTTGPERYHKYIQSWRDKNPDFAYSFWNRRKIEELWKQAPLSKWVGFYHSLRKHIEKCDFSRYAILYLYGGVYVDLDFQCLRSISPLIKDREFGWCLETESHKIPSDPRFKKVFNGFLFSKPEHWIWPRLMDHIVKNYKPGGNWTQVIKNTGPFSLGLFAYENKLCTYTPYLFFDLCSIMPINYYQRICPECPKNAIETAYSTTKWVEGSNWQNDY